MKREEAKELKYIRSKQSDSISFDRLDFLFDEIYDDFESRTCGNCKYFNEFSRCTNGVIQNTVSSNNTYEDISGFGCNKFERNGK